MDMIALTNFTRRGLRQAGLALLGALALAALLPAGAALAQQEQDAEPLRIGLIGAGRMGGAVGLQLAEAGHEVMFSSRNPDELDDLVAEGGDRASAGLPEEAASFGAVVIIAVPYGALPQVGEDYAGLMEGKVVIDLGNPRADRDGPMADDALEQGTGVASARYLPGVRLVRALNAVSFVMVQNQGRRDDGERIGVPIAGDDQDAVETAARLVRDIGFEPVIVGDLSQAERFDAGTEVYVRGMTAGELREALAL